MSLKDYAVNRDKFEYGLNYSMFGFPCCVCEHREGKAQNVEPCRTCDHNVNAVKDPPPDQSDEDPREKDESRAGIEPFQVNAER
jgi:hypothetical protein